MSEFLRAAIRDGKMIASVRRAIRRGVVAGAKATVAPDPACRRCCDLGVVARNTPSDWSTPYKGRPLRGRYLDPCPEVGCEARVREFGA